MAYPLTIFSQLSNLCAEKESSFDAYKLVAIVLNDPDDSAFIRKVHDNFVRLHYVTGSGFAFITFVEPPPSWVKDHSDWYYQEKSLSCVSNCNDKMFLNGLKKELFLGEEIPCIILTDNLKSNSYYVLRTTADTVVDQLQSIGMYVGLHRDDFDVRCSQFQDLLVSKSLSAVHYIKDNQSLASIIAALAAPREIAAFSNPDSPLAKELLGQAETYVCSYLDGLLKRREDCVNVDDEQDLLSIADKLADYRVQIIAAMRRTYASNSETMHQSFRYTIPKYDDLESDTIVYLDSYNFLTQTYLLDLRDSRSNSYNAVRRLNNILNDRNLSAMDYSPLGLYLGKIIEEELNASVVQLVRQGFGIAMPQYYRKCDKNKNEFLVETKKRKLFFNSSVSDKDLRQRMICSGELCAAIRELPKYNLTRDRLCTFGEDSFLDPVDKIASSRNNAAHPGTVFTEHEFRRMYNSFIQFYNSYMNQMIECKKRLKNI